MGSEGKSEVRDDAQGLAWVDLINVVPSSGVHKARQVRISKNKEWMETVGTRQARGPSEAGQVGCSYYYPGCVDPRLLDLSVSKR